MASRSSPDSSSTDGQQSTSQVDHAAAPSSRESNTGDQFSFGPLSATASHFHFGDFRQKIPHVYLLGATILLSVFAAVAVALYVNASGRESDAVSATQTATTMNRSEPWSSNGNSQSNTTAQIGTTGSSVNTELSVGGELYQDGSLTQYGTFRTSSGGPISITIEEMPEGELRIGLRDRSGAQFSDTLVWKEAGTQTFGHFPADTQFALNARMEACNDYCKHTWSGTLEH